MNGGDGADVPVGGADGRLGGADGRDGGADARRDGALVVIGDALLDRDVDGEVTRLAPDAPVPVLDQRGETARPGGAALAATLAAADGRPVTLVTALADDAGGAELTRLLGEAGVELIDLGLAGTTPEKIRLVADGRPLLRLDRGGAGDANRGAADANRGAVDANRGAVDANRGPGDATCGAGDANRSAGDRNGVGAVTAAARAAIGWADAVLVSDYGRGVAEAASIRAALGERIAAGLPVVWDPHPRGPAPVPGIALATPNAKEASRFAAAAAPAGGATADAAGATPAAAADFQTTGRLGRYCDTKRPLLDADRGEDPLAAAASDAATLRRAWSARAVCVTRGARGALLDSGAEAPLSLPAPAADGGDPCGAGDRFAAAAAGCLADGGDLFAAVEAAVAAASRFVAAGGAASVRVGAPTRASAGAIRAGAASVRVGAPTSASAGAIRAGAASVRVGAPIRASAGMVRAGEEHVPADPFALAAAVRERGGTVVATGGCFDLLHAGHVQTLEAAAALGDCLIVCLNADSSIRRIKGPTRPVVGERERARLLAALGCVDAVAIFEETTPVALLERLRPDVWVKGGDYDGRALPEADALARWGGRVVLVPHRAGLSTTNLIEEAANHVARR